VLRHGGRGDEAHGAKPLLPRSLGEPDPTEASIKGKAPDKKITVWIGTGGITWEYPKWDIVPKYALALLVTKPLRASLNFPETWMI
jgi:hypothetical protein